ncbi:MAG TPA: hypothetical protein VFJ19_09505 [Nocardioidaceae bacterium]|nr:hypothetical protein [Nocardioidaceae bacterium]
MPSPTAPGGGRPTSCGLGRAAEHLDRLNRLAGLVLDALAVPA